MRKKVFVILAAVLFVMALLIWFGATVYDYGSGVFNASMQLTTNEATSIAATTGRLRLQGFDVDAFHSQYNHEFVQIPATSGNHTIPADYLTLPQSESAGIIVMAHGLDSNRRSHYPLAQMFLQNGYEVLSYDQRSCGDNTAAYNTYGYLESKDMADCVAYLRDRLGSDARIGVWGTSLGGATVGIYLGSRQANQQIDFAILDSPPSSMTYLLTRTMKDMPLDKPIDFLLFSGSLVTRQKLGFSYADCDVTAHAAKTDVPVLILHSKADSITPLFMAKDIYSAIAHKHKTLVLFEGDYHSTLYQRYPEPYIMAVLDLINNSAD